MKKGLFEILSNKMLAKNTYEMMLCGDATAITTPGQFVDIKLDGFYLRRPISVCDYASDRFTIIYKTVGAGTDYMASLQPGMTIDILTGLGNGYDTAKSGNRPLLIGGGVGVPPLYALAKNLYAQNKRPLVILGFNTADEVFYAKAFAEEGCDVIVVTADGSAGMRGFVTDAINRLTEKYTFFYACGPLAMLKAVSDIALSDGELSLEERMGCGFGACMGCSIMTKQGAKRVCKDGPVFGKETLIW